MTPIAIRSWPRAIVHLDGDAFFASCEQAIHPEYRGKPVVTGKERGIVSAASYEAKAKGVTRGVPLWNVKKICPDAIIVSSDYETYSLFSKRMFMIMRRFTSIVEEYSIDEAFADITGLRRPLHASYEEIARQMKDAVEKELGITVSVGVSLSKVLAKVGSKWNKPSGLTAISGKDIHLFLDKTPVEKIWGIGPQTTAYCRTLKILTALEFARQSETFIRAHFAKPQVEIWQELNGHSVYSVTTEEKEEYASISKFKTFTPPSHDKEFLYAQLLKNLENACVKARRYCLVAPKIVACLRTQGFRDRAIEVTLSRPSAYPPEIAFLLRQTFDQLFKPATEYRATGIVLVGLRSGERSQLSLFESPLRLEKLERVYEAVDALNEKMGRNTVHLTTSTLARSPDQKRGGIPERQLERLKGENRYQHLAIPLLMKKV